MQCSQKQNWNDSSHNRKYIPASTNQVWFSINQFIKKQKDQTATYIAVKYMTCNDARPIINTYKHILLRAT